MRWRIGFGDATRGGLPRRAYTVTPSGTAALRASRDVLQRMWRGVEHALREPSR